MLAGVLFLSGCKFMAASDDLIVRWLLGELKEGTAEELKARRDIAAMLLVIANRRRDPLKQTILAGLAALIDPDARSIHGWWLAAKRPPGAKPTMDRLRVAEIIDEQVKRGIKKEAAVKEAMTLCNVKSRDKALAAYKHWKPFLDRRKRKAPR